MLNKIGFFTLFVVMGCWYIILLMFPNIDLALKNVLPNGGTIKFIGIDIKFYFFIISIIIAIIARAIRLHDRISDMLKIRKKYDLDNILLPLGVGCGYKISSIEKINEKRSVLMSSCFYKYCSYSQPKIDAHLVYTTLDYLCWYWIAVEAQFFTFITLVLTLFSSNITIIKLVVIANLIFYCFGKIMNNACMSKTSSEIFAILSDTQRKKEIFQEYTNAL